MATSSTTTIATKSAMIFGGTGTVGKHLVREVLQSGKYSRVAAVGRRKFEYDGPGKELLEQKVIDFENLEASKDVFVGYDTIFCTLGTTRAQAGSAQRFVEIDKDYVVNSAKMIHAQNPGRAINYLYCSSKGASASSMLLYFRTKGETEKELGEIGFSQVTIFQPSLLKAPKEEGGKNGFLIGTLEFFGIKDWVEVSSVAKTMRRWADGDTRGKPVDSKKLENGTLFEIVNNEVCRQLGTEE